MPNFHRKDNIVLNGLKNQLIEAANALATAEAVDSALSARLERFETAYDAALTASNTSETNFADGLKAATDLAGNRAASHHTGKIADRVVSKSHRVFVQAYKTAVLTVEAAYTIVDVQTEKDVIVAKSQLKDLPHDYIAKIEQAVIDAEAAVKATTAALQAAMQAYAAAKKAAATVDSVSSTLTKTLSVMAPKVDFPIRDVKHFVPKGGLLLWLYRLDQTLQERTDLLRDVTHQAKVQLKRADNQLAAATATEEGAQEALRAGLVAVNRAPTAAAVALVREISALKAG